MYRIKSNFKNIMIILADCFSILVSLMMSNYIRHHSLLYFSGSANDILSLMAIFIISYFLVYLLINFNLNYLGKSTIHELFDILKMHIAMLASAMVIIYFTRIVTDFSRKVFIYFFIIDTVLMLLLHTLIKCILHYYYKQSASLRQILVITSNNSKEIVINRLLESEEHDYQITAIAIVDQEETDSEFHNIPIITGLSNLISYCKSAPLDEALISLNLEHLSLLEDKIKEISSMGIVVHINIDNLFHEVTSHKVVSHFGSYYVLTYANRFLSIRQILAKRLLDIIGGIIGTALLIPMTVILAPIICLESPGPIFFVQKRVGKNGRTFNMYKFRSMYVDAENRKEELMCQNEMKGLMFKLKDDPRITKIGRFIRRTSLDEFPQFFNILKGDMSLVGTRPPTLEEFEQYQSYHKKRLSTTPGLTGLWQVSGRNDINNFEDVVTLDIEYIDNWSLGMDLKILWKTIIVVMKKNGAE